jgi:hypothetical protein
MVLRDFSDEAKSRLEAAIDSCTPAGGDFIAGLADWVGDLLRDPGIPYLAGDVDEYYATLLDKNNTTKAQLASIFAKAAEADAAHAAKFRGLAEGIEAAAEGMRRLAALWDDSAGRPAVFGSAGAFAARCHAEFAQSLEAAYDRLLQGRVLALLSDPEFSLEAWEALDRDGKEAFLNRLLARVQAILGTSCEPLIRLLSPQRASTLAWRGYDSASGNHFVAIDAEDFDRLIGEGPEGREALMRAVFHEARHVYQAEVMDDYNDRLRVAGHREAYGSGTIINLYSSATPIPSDSAGPLRHPLTSDDTAWHWIHDTTASDSRGDSRADFLAYVGTTVEYDAWNFSGEFAQMVEGSKLSKEELEGMNIQYSGSWGVPQ